MALNEHQTCKELIEPALQAAGWSWQVQVRIGPGRVNLAGESMYDETQAIIADYVLRYKNIPLAKELLLQVEAALATKTRAEQRAPHGLAAGSTPPEAPPGSAPAEPPPRSCACSMAASPTAQTLGGDRCTSWPWSRCF